MFTVGNGLAGAWNCQYATAIKPERTNATGRVNSPNANINPPTNSNTPPNQICVPNAAVLLSGGMPFGNAKSFIVPPRTNIAPAVMRSNARKYGAHEIHVREMFRKELFDIS